MIQTVFFLDHATAKLVASAAISEATNLGWSVTVVVTDNAGIPLVVERMDNAPPGSYFKATGKAYTAAMERRPTSVAEEGLAKRPGVYPFEGFTPITGGLPLNHLGTFIGAIGVSGMKSEQDLHVAEAGAKVLLPQS